MKKTNPEQTKNLVESHNKTFANYNSIAIFFVVIIPAYIVFLVFDSPKPFLENLGFKSGVAVGFIIFVFVVGLLLLRLDKISVIGFGLMATISWGVMTIFMTSQLDLWKKLLIVVGFLVLSFPLLNLFKMLGEKINNIKINRKGNES